MEIIFCRCFVIVILIERQLYLHTGELNYLTLSRKKSLWDHYTPFTRYNRLSIRLCNRFDNQLYRVNKHPTGCQTRFDNRVERTATVRSTGCQTRLYNRFDNRLYTRYSRLSNRLSNGLSACIHDTTGCQ